jgi:hypothetical protein
MIMPCKRVPFDEETSQGRSQFAGLFLAEVIAHFVRKRQHPGPAIASRRCLDEELCSDRPYRNLRFYLRRASCCLSVPWPLSAVERAF